ncbi:polymerase zeta subunit [Terfezia claveryi]|nr:polymerase zeta subunit [Terfezia claveryi]
MSFRVRLNNIDSYQARPSPLDPLLPSIRPGQAPRSVPVIRIYGATETGQKVCTHVHGVFPYLYVEYTGSLVPDEVDAYIRRLHVGIDRAMAVAYRSERRDPYVARITLCKGVPFYGFHVGYKLYLKIYLLNPSRMTRLADLLRGGAVGKQCFQPYEAHIPYILAFMIDFNLYGCGFVDCEKVKFRTPVPSAEEVGPDALWNDETISQDMFLSEDEFPRLSHCALEVDVQIQDLLNQRQISPRLLHHDFIERLNPLPADMKFVHSLAELWRDDARRRGLAGRAMEDVPSMSSSARDINAKWIHEEEYMEKINDIIDEERRRADKPFSGFDCFVRRKPFEGLVRTVVDSVKDFFPENQSEYGVFVGTAAEQKQKLEEEVEIDEALINQVVAEAEEEAKATASEDLDDFGVEEGDEPAPDVDQKVDVATNLKQDRNPSIPTPSERRIAIGNQHSTDEVPMDDDDFDVPIEFFSNTAPKRLASLVDPNPTPLKLRRIDLSSPAPNPIVNQGRSFREKIPNACSSGQRSQLSPTGYPVIKLPDRSTILRLSQERASPKSRVGELIPLGSSNQSSHLSASFLFSDNNVTNRIKSISSKIEEAFGSMSPYTTFLYDQLAPSNAELELTFDSLGMSQKVYQDAYYSNEKDVPPRPREYAGREFRLQSTTVPFLPDFDPSGDSSTALRVQKPNQKPLPTMRVWEILQPPPIRAETDQWLAEQVAKRDKIAVVSEAQFLSQIEGPTQRNRHGFKYSQRRKSAAVEHEAQHMSIMSLEVHVNTRGSLFPDPAQDEIACIFWCIQSNNEQLKSNGIKEGYHVGILVLAEQESVVEKLRRMVRVTVEEEYSELDLITRLVDIVRDLDPDILTGYEIHNASWGYIIERAKCKYEYNLTEEFSRMRSQSHGRFGKEADNWGFNTTAAIKITGRHIINIWRAMRGELNLSQYTMENIVFHVLHKRIPHYNHKDLTTWYKSGRVRHLNRLLNYFVLRVQLDLDILEANELVVRTSEQARLLGIDFQSVYGRGSQFKVESMMFRIGKPEGFMMVSPSKKQVGTQNALECLPLVMEPQSAFYTSPLVVLDFQSLYPSLMIAYNYCYSTFLGRVTSWRGQNKMGFTNYDRKPRVLELLKDYVRVAPNGIMYVKQELRKSLLAKMLAELLETRIMVKNGMKRDKDDKTLQQLLNNRQLALKLVANVTYGYTGATMSGRMPCAEIADSIVQTGRETLEKAIELIHSKPKWGAEVVYGDTDSLFIYLPGRARAEAFDIGEDIAKTITSMNPKPVKLKFEKVYHPCILLAKKRYVGFKYEHRNQKEPDFDAKGIETVRRDGTPAQQKIEETVLKILFRTSDLSQVKEYFQRQCSKIMSGKVSIQDFCFAKEVKMGMYSENGTLPAGAKISAERMEEDHRAEPQYGERVPYVVIAGAPGSRLIDRTVTPETLLYNAHHRLDAEYYITKNLIPPLERILNLVGADIRAWYNEMPKIRKIMRVENVKVINGAVGNSKKSILESYMKSSTCLVCKGKVDVQGSCKLKATHRPFWVPVCTECMMDRDTSVYNLRTQLKKSEKRNADFRAICRSCAGLTPVEEIPCDSKDCPVFYSRVRQAGILEADRQSIGQAIKALEDLDLDW